MITYEMGFLVAGVGIFILGMLAMGVHRAAAALEDIAKHSKLGNSIGADMSNASHEANRILRANLALQEPVDSRPKINLLDPDSIDSVGNRQ